MHKGTKKYGFIIVATILVIVAAMLVGGCSGTPAAPESTGKNNTGYATLPPEPVAGAGNNSAANVTNDDNLTTNRMIGYERAISSVRDFLADPAANVTVQSVVPTFYGAAYSLERDGDLFLVNGQTGEVEYADFSSNPAGNFLTGNSVINGEQGRSIAQAYAQEHYGGFTAADNMDFMGSALRQDDAGGYFYDYEWREMINTTKMLNDVIVTVGVGSGKVHSYQSIRVPAGAEANFTVSKRAAARIAVSQLGNITSENTLSDDEADWNYYILFKYAFPDQNGSMYGNYTISDLVIHPDLARNRDNVQRVIWNIGLAAGPVLENGNVPSPWYYWIYLDAGTGEVLQLIHSR